MSRVTNYLRNAIIKHVAEHGLVVWYDPDRHYTAVVDSLTISNTAVVRYEDSFFALRRAVEPLLEQTDPPRLVVYIPLDQAGTYHALIELESAGVILKPGEQPPSRNTRLAVIARNALKPVLTNEKVAEIEQQVDAGKLTLADLDNIAAKGGDVAGVISVIFNTSQPLEVALTFLTNPALDAEIVAKGAGDKLAGLLQNAFEVDLSGVNQLDPLRDRLAQHLLLTDLVAALPEPLPPQLSTVKIASQPAAREVCLKLAGRWRQQRDLRDSYLSRASQVEKSLKLARFEFDPAHLSALARVETFLAVEQKLQDRVTAALLAQANPELVELARLRQSSFWSEARPDTQAEWGLIAVAGQVLLEAGRIEQELKQPGLNAKIIFKNYTGIVESEQGSVTSDKDASLLPTSYSLLPWCLLDTYHRHMERRCHHFDFDLGGRHANLEKLIAKARERYMAVGASLAKAFLEQFQQAHFHLSGIACQVETFTTQIKPALAQGKIAYIWTDALRFEMARELAQSLGDEFDVQVQAALGTAPTITEIGMAALLPNADAEPTASIVSVGNGKLGLKMGGTIIKDRKGRVDYLTAHAGVTVFAARLDELLPKPGKKVQQGIASADLILVTSQEIDQLCEGDNIHLARRTMDEILHELRRVLRLLSELGLQTIILTADHGYLFGEEPGEDMKIDPPGGHTIDLKRRVWIGRGGDSHPAYLRTDLANLGLSSEFELVTPWNFAIFKVAGGARAYFHGGLSPQELVIPILTITSKGRPAASLTSAIAWTLRLGSSSMKVSRFCSVQVGGQSEGLFDLVSPKVRVEARAQGKVISAPVTASYGFEEGTGDTQLELKADDPRTIEPNSIALRFTDDTPQKNVSIHLLDAASGVELKRLEGVEVVSGI